jgi:uncharacterized integral membrane protein
MQYRSLLSIDRLLLTVLITGIAGFVSLFTFLLIENTGRTVSMKRWAWFLGLGLVILLSTYFWFTQRLER